MDKLSYAEWIAQVRGKLGLSHAKFCKMLFRYGKDMEIKSFSRNASIPWEEGSNLPWNMETLIAIALLEFDYDHAKDVEKDISQWSNEFRNKRYEFVSKKMLMYLGRELYVRTLREMLLVELCRGIISCEELLDLEQELLVRLEECKKYLTKEKLKKEIESSGTIPISKDVYHIKSKEEIYGIVDKFGGQFVTASKTLGDRFKTCYKERQRYGEVLSLAKAVSILAPHYRGTYQRVLEGDMGITREWIIDFCIHLRFNREEIQHILKRAHFIGLSEDECQEEKYYTDKEYQIGSARWYLMNENDYPGVFRGHYAAFKEMSLERRIACTILAYIGIKEWDYTPKKGFFPADHLLESFFYVQSEGAKALKELYAFRKKITEAGNIDADEMIEECAGFYPSAFAGYLMEGMVFGEDLAAQKVYENYQGEFRAYYELSDEKLEYLSKEDRKEAVKLKYLASLMYTIIHGKYYEGVLRMEEQKILTALFKEQGCPDTAENTANYWNDFWYVFLGNRPLYRNKKGQFYVLDEKGEKTCPYAMADLGEDLWATLLDLEDSFLEMEEE